MMSWRHTVLELYPKPLSGEFPSEGDPADWIEEGTVLYCQGRDETVVYFAPLWWILWVKAKKYAYEVYAFLFNNIWAKTPWWKRQTEKFWDEMEENTISTEEFLALVEEWDEDDRGELEELLGPSLYDKEL